jgi:hypothetical protein
LRAFSQRLTFGSPANAGPVRRLQRQELSDGERAALALDSVGEQQRDARPPRRLSPVHLPALIASGPSRRPRITFLLSAALLAAAAAPPPAAPPPRPAPQQIFLSPAGKPFRSAPGAPYPVADWFREADADGNGRLTRAEFIADGERYFHRLDSSRNDQLEADEIDAYEAAVLGPITGRGTLRGAAPAAEEKAAPAAPPPGAPPPGTRPVQMPASAAAPPRERPRQAPVRGAGLYALIDIPHPVKAADRDMNARVTAEEWRRVMGGRFDLLDPQRRGDLTLEELPATPWQTQQPGYKPKRK